MEIVTALPAGAVAATQATRTHAHAPDTRPVTPAARSSAAVLATCLADAFRFAPLALLPPGLGGAFAADETAAMQHGAGQH